MSGLLMIIHVSIQGCFMCPLETSCLGALLQLILLEDSIYIEAFLNFGKV